MVVVRSAMRLCERTNWNTASDSPATTNQYMGSKGDDKGNRKADDARNVSNDIKKDRRQMCYAKTADAAAAFLCRKLKEGTGARGGRLMPEPQVHAPGHGGELKGPDEGPVGVEENPEADDQYGVEYKA